MRSHLSPTDSAIVWQLRAPRVVLALLVGGMLALAGGAYQGVFRNPLVDPYLLGVAAGAGLGATIAIAYARGAADSYDLLPLAAFAGAALGVALAYSLGASAASAANPAALVLAGVTIVSFLTAVQTFIQQQHAQSLQQVYSWILGSVDTAGWHDVRALAPYVAVASIVILLHRRVFDVLAVGDDEAATLGVNVRRVRLTIVVFATIGTAAVVAVSGLIGFVGIIVPHFVRLAVRIELPGRPAALAPPGRGVSRPLRRPGAHPHLPRRAADRRRHRVLRRAVLRHRAAFQQELQVTVVSLGSLSVELGRTRVLHEVDAGVTSGEWVALIGPNGAGKSTLLRALAGLVTYSGSATLDGDEVSRLPRRTLARRLAFVPQAPLLPAGMRVGEYVLLGRTRASRAVRGRERP